MSCLWGSVTRRIWMTSNWCYRQYILALLQPSSLLLFSLSIWTPTSHPLPILALVQSGSSYSTTSSSQETSLHCALAIVNLLSFSLLSYSLPLYRHPICTSHLSSYSCKSVMIQSRCFTDYLVFRTIVGLVVEERSKVCNSNAGRQLAALRLGGYRYEWFGQQVDCWLCCGCIGRPF